MPLYYCHIPCHEMPSHSRKYLTVIFFIEWFVKRLSHSELFFTPCTQQLGGRRQDFECFTVHTVGYIVVWNGNEFLWFSEYFRGVLVLLFQFLSSKNSSVDRQYSIFDVYFVAVFWDWQKKEGKREGGGHPKLSTQLAVKIYNYSICWGQVCVTRSCLNK